MENSPAHSDTSILDQLDLPILLSKHSSALALDRSVSSDKNHGKNITFNQALSQLTFSILPLYVQFSLLSIGYALNLYFVSSYNDPLLVAAVGLGNACSEFFIASIIITLNAGLCTILSQANGAKQPKIMAKYFEKGLVINIVVIVLGVALLLASEHLFMLLGYDPALSTMASKYIKYIIPSIVAMGMFDMLINLAQAHLIFVMPPSFSSSVLLLSAHFHTSSLFT